MRLPARVLLLVPRVHKTLMADEEIAPCKGFGTYIADKWLLFSMRSYMSLQMFLSLSCQLLVALDPSFLFLKRTSLANSL